MPRLRRPGLKLVIEKTIVAEMGLLGRVLRLNPGPLVAGVIVKDDPRAPDVVAEREPGTKLFVVLSHRKVAFTVWLPQQELKVLKVKFVIVTATMESARTVIGAATIITNSPTSTQYLVAFMGFVLRFFAKRGAGGLEKGVQRGDPAHLSSREHIAKRVPG